MSSDESSWSFLHAFHSAPDAQFACSILRSAGIETFVSNDIPVARHGAIIVSVHENDLPEARRIIATQISNQVASVSDDVQDAGRVGAVFGAIVGGFLGQLLGGYSLLFGIVLGAAVGAYVAVRRWRARHPEARRAGQENQSI